MIPDKAELRSRILEHLQARPDSPTVAAVWHGYLAGLVEWGVLESQDHVELLKLLPPHGKVETNEVLLGPNHLERVAALVEEDKRERQAAAAGIRGLLPTDQPPMARSPIKGK